MRTDVQGGRIAFSLGGVSVHPAGSPHNLRYQSQLSLSQLRLFSLGTSSTVPSDRTATRCGVAEFPISHFIQDHCKKPPQILRDFCLRSKKALGGPPTSCPFPNETSPPLSWTLCSRSWLCSELLSFAGLLCRIWHWRGGKKKSLSSCRSTLRMKTDAYFLPSIFHTPGFTSEDCNETSTLSRCLWTTVVLSGAVEQPWL